MTHLNTNYLNLTNGAGFVQLNDRTLVTVAGADRHKFLHSFCTADIKGLEVGKTTEAFVLNEKGKVLSHVLVLNGPDQILLSGAGRQAESLISHLDKYIIREDVQLTDQSDQQSAFFVCGVEAADRLIKMMIGLPKQNEVIAGSVNDVELQIANVEVAGWGYLLLVAADDQATLANALTAANIPEMDDTILQIVRIENGTPWFGFDISDANLPQEIQRDTQAISFNKGCYLGQETVARIDAIGHVNQLLVRLSFEGPTTPAVGSELLVSGKPAGRVTSIASSSESEGWIGLGYVKRAYAKEGSTLEIVDGVALVR